MIKFQKNTFWKWDKDQDKDNKDSNEKEENKDLGAMNPVQLCGMLDVLIGNKEAQDEITKVRNHKELCRKLKVLENESSWKKRYKHCD